MCCFCGCIVEPSSEGSLSPPAGLGELLEIKDFYYFIPCFHVTLLISGEMLCTLIVSKIKTHMLIMNSD